MPKLRSRDDIINACVEVAIDMQTRFNLLESSGASPAVIARFDRIGQSVAVEYERFTRKLVFFLDGIDRELGKAPRPPSSRPPSSRSPSSAPRSGARIYSFRPPKKGPRR